MLLDVEWMDLDSKAARTLPFLAVQARHNTGGELYRLVRSQARSAGDDRSEAWRVILTCLSGAAIQSELRGDPL